VAPPGFEPATHIYRNRHIKEPRQLWAIDLRAITWGILFSQQCMWRFYFLRKEILTICFDVRKLLETWSCEIGGEINHRSEYWYWNIVELDYKGWATCSLHRVTRNRQLTWSPVESSSKLGILIKLYIPYWKTSQLPSGVYDGRPVDQYRIHVWQLKK